MKLKSLLPLLLFFVSSFTYAGGIKGTIKDTKGEILPFAAIQVKGQSIGTMANEEGKYELSLLPGSYEIQISYIGFQTLIEKVEIKSETITLNITLKEQIVNLGEVKVLSNNEDPANTIMRKAIAMAKIHLLEVNGYTGKCYIRGGGRLTKIPGLAKMAFKDEFKKAGIDENTVFFNESLSEISYQYPSKFKQNVLSIRSNIDQEAASPNQYINTRFYNPSVVGAVSPLSPRAFAYYRFEYLGTFTDRGYEVSKIKVIPRSAGDDVFNGVISITENQWSIHSLSLATMKDGINIDVQQIYAPIQEVWMPVTMKIKIVGGMFGFKGEYSYNATVNNYKININQKFHNQIEVIDEKVDKTETKLERITKDNSKKIDFDKTIAKNKELNRKQLKKLVNEYEKEDLRKKKEDDKVDVKVIRNDSVSIDKQARKRSIAFWDSIRSVPLTQLEIKSTLKFDSIKVVQKAKAEKDTLKKVKASKFNLGTLLVGGTFRIDKKDTTRLANGSFKHKYSSSIIYESPLTSLNFNTLEGYFANLGIGYIRRSLTSSFKTKATSRYGFSSKQFYGILENRYRYKTQEFKLNGGSWIQQFNNEGIDPSLNSITSLMFSRNYMKLFQKEYLEFAYQNKFSDVITLKTSFQFQNRTSLTNKTDFKYWKFKDRIYTENLPVNYGRFDEPSPNAHQASTLEAELTYRPFLRYRIYNGIKRINESYSPIIKANFRAGIPNTFGSDVDYQYLELSIQHKQAIGVRGELNYALKAGSFLNNTSTFFPDYKHFAGNQTIIQYGNPVTAFRLLDYYLYSTNRNFVEAHGMYYFRKFLATQIPMVRMTGIKENIFVNYLAINDLKYQYTEIGYGLQGILRLFSVEAIANFNNGKYQGVGFRVGITKNIRIQQNDD